MARDYDPVQGKWYEDLEENEIFKVLSVDPDQDFAMEWQVSPDKTRQLKAITEEAKNADTLILATDPDREGEAISWHLAEVLKRRKALPAKVQRVFTRLWMTRKGLSCCKARPTSRRKKDTTA